MGDGLSSAYFNYAGLAPTCQAADERRRRVEAEFAEVLFSDAGVDLYRRVLEGCRDDVRALIGASDAMDVALLPNASTALNVLLGGLPLETGRTIVTSDQEHPTLELLFEGLERRGVGVQRVQSHDEEEFVAAVDGLVRRGGVAAIVLSHVSYKDGRVHPVDRVGRIAVEHDDLVYLIDGSQAVGHVPVDVSRLGPAAYVFSGHKWLFGPMGTGGMWLHDRLSKRVALTWSSWMWKGEESGARRFEAGTLNVGLVAGLGAAARDALRYQDERRTRLEHWRAWVVDRLADIRFWEASRWRGAFAPGIVSYELPDRLPSTVFVRRIADDYGVILKGFSPPERPNAVRISLSPWTTSEEAARLVSALHKATGRARPAA